MRNRSKLQTLHWISVMLCFHGSTSIALSQPKENYPSNAINEKTALMLRLQSKNSSIAKDVLPDRSTARLDFVSQVFESGAEIVNSSRATPSFMLVDLPDRFEISSRIFVSAEIGKQDAEGMIEGIWRTPANAFEHDDARANPGWNRFDMYRNFNVNKQKVDQSRESVSGEWVEAMECNQEFPIVLIVRPPNYFVSVLSELNPSLPDYLGGLQLSSLVSNMKWLSFGYDPYEAKVRLIIQSTSEQAVDSLLGEFAKFLGLVDPLLVSEKDVRKSLVEEIGITKRGSQIRLEPHSQDHSERVCFSIKKAGESLSQMVAESQTANSLNKLILACHDYHELHGVWPPYSQVVSSTELSKLSWRVQILPHLGYADLYSKFRHNEAWDSPHNLALLDQMPIEYAPYVAANERHLVPSYSTTYLAPVGKDTLLGQSRPMGLVDVIDSTYQTVGIVEVRFENAIPWTSPEEYRYSEALPTANMRTYQGHYQVAFLDGSIQARSAALPKEFWNGVFTCKGGENIDSIQSK